MDRGEGGVSLVEVMVACGVVVLGGLFFATVSVHNTKFSKQLRQSSDLIRENQAVKTLIENTPKETVLYWMCPDPCFFNPGDANSYNSRLTGANNLLHPLKYGRDLLAHADALVSVIVLESVETFRRVSV